MKTNMWTIPTSKVGFSLSCAISSSIIIGRLYVATVVDKTDDLYHLNISQDSGLTTPEGSYAVKEISQALNSFSDEYRVPFNMYVAGYKYHEIADKLENPLGTVKSRIFFARKRLRSELADYQV